MIFFLLASRVLPQNVGKITHPLHCHLSPVTYGAILRALERINIIISSSLPKLNCLLVTMKRLEKANRSW